MGRSVRNSVVLAKIETTSGTDAAPTNTDDAVLLMAQGLSCKISTLFAERDVLRGGFGAPDRLPYARRGSIGYQVELAGSGTPATAPGWAKLLQPAGFAGTSYADSRAEYTPVSTGIKTLTQHAYWDGALRRFVYCAANAAKLMFTSGQLPMLEVAYSSLVVDAPSAAGNPVPTLTGWQRSQAVGPANSGKFIMGGTYSAGAITTGGGTAYDWQSCELDTAPSVEDVPLVTAEAIDLDNRAPTASVTLQLTAAQEAALQALMHAGTATSIGMRHGTAEGNRVGFFAAGAKIIDISDAPQGNKLLTKIDFALPPVATSGDEFVIWTM
jgi:hypothetical protein